MKHGLSADMDKVIIRAQFQCRYRQVCYKAQVQRGDRGIMDGYLTMMCSFSTVSHFNSDQEGTEDFNLKDRFSQLRTFYMETVSWQPVRCQGICKGKAKVDRYLEYKVFMIDCSAGLVYEYEVDITNKI